MRTPTLASCLRCAAVVPHARMLLCSSAAHALQCRAERGAALQAEEEEADDGRTRPKVRRTQVVVSAEVKAKHAGAQAQIDQGAGLSDAEIASARRVLVEHMQSRETVMQALTRLSAKPRDSQVPPQLLALLCTCSRLSKTHMSCAGFINCPLLLLTFDGGGQWISRLRKFLVDVCSRVRGRAWASAS